MDIKESFYRVMDKLSEGAEVTMKQLKKKFDAGTHEAMNDPKPGYHVELRNTKTGKRTTHYVKEEVEQIDEISASTLHSYIDKSRADKKAAMKDRTAAEKNIRTYGGMAMDKKERDSAVRRSVNRSQGISVANQKLGTYSKDKVKAKVMAREEVEQLDEIGDTAKGRKALKAVIARAPEKAANLRMKSDILGRRQFDPDVSHENSEKYGKASDAAYKRYQNTVKGAARAVDRLTKEEVEQIDEAGPAKLVSYGPKGDRITANRIADHISKRANDYSGTNAELVKKLSSEVSKHGDTTANELIKKHKDIAKNVGMDAKAAHDLISGSASAIKEEVEQIDELSKKTLGSYINKAAMDMASNRSASGKEMAKPLSKRDFNVARTSAEKYFKRKGGIEKAVNKLTKEEADTSSKETVIKSVKPHVTTDTTTVLPSDVKPQRVKLAQFKKLFN